MIRRHVAALTLVGLLLLTAHAAVIPATSNQAHPAGACSAPYHIQGAGWDFCWQQENARVQGLEINRAFFHGESVAWKMGVPFTLTKYESASTGPFKDVLGTPGGGIPGYGLGAMSLSEDQCPRFFGEGERLHNNRVCVEHRYGSSDAVAIWSHFNVFNYRFLQGWTFDDAGTITPMIAMGGRLIDGNHIGADGLNHYHHLYWRLDLDIASPGNDAFSQFQRIDTAGGPLGHVLNLLDCDTQDALHPTAWCDVPVETKLTREEELGVKWRVRDTEDTNSLGRHKSYEIIVHRDHTPDHYSTFDAMLVQYKGDSQEIGYEVPTNPLAGDTYMDPYVIPPEPVDDPVVWISLHIYHDTRDEERGSMNWHWVDYKLRPYNLLDSNPGESTWP